LQYSYGLLLHEVLHGAMAFQDLSSMDAFFAASSGVRPPIDLSSLPAEYRDLKRLIEQCWHRCSEDRPPAQEVVDTLLSLSQHLEDAGEMPGGSPCAGSHGRVPLLPTPHAGKTAVLMRPYGSFPDRPRSLGGDRA